MGKPAKKLVRKRKPKAASGALSPFTLINGAYMVAIKPGLRAYILIAAIAAVAMTSVLWPHNAETAAITSARYPIQVPSTGIGNEISTITKAVMPKPFPIICPLACRRFSNPYCRPYCSRRSLSNVCCPNLRALQSRCAVCCTPYSLIGRVGHHRDVLSCRSLCYLSFACSEVSFTRVRQNQKN